MEVFYNVKNGYHLLRQKVRQRISVMKTNTGVFVVFKTKRELNCQFSGTIECVCSHYWDSLMNFFDIVNTSAFVTKFPLRTEKPECKKPFREQA